MENKVLIVIADYYKNIAKNLENDSISVLNDHKIYYDIIHVPGTFEISLAIKKYIIKNKYKGYIALGCVIKGETYHFELISNECAKSLNYLSLKYIVPIGFGVITCNTLIQAEERSQINNIKNKGKIVSS